MCFNPKCHLYSSLMLRSQMWPHRARLVSQLRGIEFRIKATGENLKCVSSSYKLTWTGSLLASSPGQAWGALLLGCLAQECAYLDEAPDAQQVREEERILPGTPVTPYRASYMACQEGLETGGFGLSNQSVP